MGHLVNPIAFRLGHTRSWEDNWYIKNIYYPEFLHSILKIRHYLYHFWTTRYMEKKGILLSHFYIYKFIKNLLIKIFLYNIDLEKNIYSFFARGNNNFSEAFYYRFKKKGKKKEPFSYERYKPDLFFMLFLYFNFFSIRKKIKIQKQHKKSNFMKKKKTVKIFKTFWKKKKEDLSSFYLNNLKKNKLKFFIKLPKDIKLEENSLLKISNYEDKIKKINKMKLNIGFLDFLTYIFFKINMLEKRKEEIEKRKKRRRTWEMIPNYPLKLQKWIDFLKIYVNVNVKLSIKKKKSIKNFIFFLTFILTMYTKLMKESIRTKLKLKELNLKLLRIFIYNKILNKFAFFYGKFLRNILYILTNINKYSFKFCFITNNSINAKFLARYMGLKLKRKFPLFSVINPLKKELKKLSHRKKERKTSLLLNLFNYKKKNLTNNVETNYKNSFKNVLLYLNDKYLESLIQFYKNNKTFITFTIFIYYIYIINKNKTSKINFYWKFYFIKNIKEKKWKKKLNLKWIIFLKYLFKKNNKCKEYLLEKKKLLGILYLYFKNNFLMNLFFSFNKYNADNLALNFFFLKFDIKSFFYINKDYVCLLLFIMFNTYTFLNTNTLLKRNFNFLVISNYFFKTYIYYLYTYYSLNKFMNYLKVNKKLLYFKTKELYKVNSFILGFKMSFKGRFTRKQRASSIWFHQGFVPLNTIKGNIDFAFFTIPLKNSAISIKLWLYKNTDKMLWHSKFLNKN